LEAGRNGFHPRRFGLGAFHFLDRSRENHRIFAAPRAGVFDREMVRDTAIRRETVREIDRQTRVKMGLNATKEPKPKNLNRSKQREPRKETLHFWTKPGVSKSRDRPPIQINIINSIHVEILAENRRGCYPVMDWIPLIQVFLMVLGQLGRF
jgi:hypothetical protein